MQVDHLNKYQYLTGAFCPKALHLATRGAPETPDAAVRMRMEEGRQVGAWARDGFPGGVLVDETGFESALRTTRRLVADPGVPILFEAAFEHTGLRVRPDILVRRGGAWDLIEVKSSTSLKDDHVADIALTRHVIASSGLTVARCRLRLINRDFRLGMPLQRFFRDHDVTSEALVDPETVRATTPALLEALCDPAPPDSPLGLHCRNCAYRDACVPPDHILNLPNLREKKYSDLCARGIDRIPDIPDPVSLSEIQNRMRDALRTGLPRVGPGLADALRLAVPPLFFLDFESVAAACPLYPDVAPHASLPTQYSIHVLAAPGHTPEHLEFLHEDRSDPCRPVAENLLRHLGREGSIVVYSGYEQRMISSLADRLPDLAPGLNALLPRLYDLCAVITRHVYHPGFQGSFSVKRTLPALVPDLGYDDLTIADGGTASAAYREMIAPETPPDRRREIARSLRDYCARDSLAMVRLFESLRRIV